MPVAFVNNLQQNIKEYFIKYFEGNILDLETMVINDKLEPFTACYYDGINKFSFYLTDYKNSEEMLLAVIESLLKPK